MQIHNTSCFELFKSIKSESIDAIITDPPYNLSQGGTTCQNGKRTCVDKGRWDRKNQAEFYEFTQRWLVESKRVLKPGGNLWVSNTLHSYPTVGIVLQELGFKIINDIIWEKPAPPPNLGCRCFTHSTELLFWATKFDKNHSYTFNYKISKGFNDGKQCKNVWRIAPPLKSEKEFGKHPTQKPAQLWRQVLLTTTSPGDTILDPFMGTGSLAIACLGTDRDFIGCDIEPKYIEIAKKRIDHFQNTQPQIANL